MHLNVAAGFGDYRLRLDREAGKVLSERRSQDGAANGTTWGDITKESEECKSRR